MENYSQSRTLTFGNIQNEGNSFWRDCFIQHWPDISPRRFLELLSFRKVLKGFCRVSVNCCTINSNTHRPTIAFYSPEPYERIRVLLSFCLSIVDRFDSPPHQIQVLKYINIKRVRRQESYVWPTKWIKYQQMMDHFLRSLYVSQLPGGRSWEYPLIFMKWGSG
jgi:hypothetical protein